MSDDDLKSRSIVAQLASQFPPYSGDPNYQVLTAYIHNVLFRLAGSLAAQHNLIEMSLIDDARKWYDNLRAQPGSDKLTGSQILDLLKESYFSSDFGDAALVELQSFKRGNASLASYLADFTRLKLNVPVSYLTDDMLRVYLIMEVGTPYTAELARQHLKTFAATFGYLQAQVNTDDLYS